MCGFAGIYEFGTPEGGVRESVLTSMRETVRHRGPDGCGNYLSPDRRVGLSHRRLAIVDLAGGAQPMTSPEGVWLVFNGEIYNYPQLRATLERAGRVFRTNCDTEVILHLYALYGTKCVEELEGMFAFALWDPRDESLFLARDRVGEKPVYWWAQDGRLVFGSEVKAILEHPAVSRVLNEAALDTYLAQLVAPSPTTLFAGINKLPAGSMAVCTRDGVTVSQYWTPFEPREFANVSLREAAAKVRSMLAESVSSRLMSDVPVGVLLSGGLDSTTLLALLREHAKGIPTFSVGTSDDPKIDERAQARWVARHYGTDHHEVNVDETSMLAFLGTFLRHQDEPLADPVSVPLHFVCELARQNGVPVVLAGEGADEMFWGYPAYTKVMRRGRWFAVAARSPALLRRAFPAVAALSTRTGAHELAAELAAGRIAPLHSNVGMKSAERQRALLRPNPDGLGLAPSRARSVRGFLDELAFDTQEYEFGQRLPELLLMRIDRFSMANSVEARVPFLDYRLVDYAYRLPIHLKVNRTDSKIVLREAVRDIVPHDVLVRPKQGFGAPISKWFEGRLSPVLRELAKQDTLRAYFDTAELESLIANHQRGAQHAFALWPILNFALWHKVWIEREEFDLEGLLGASSA